MNRLLVVAGTAAVVVGLAAFVAPGLVSGVPLPGPVVAIVGLFGLLAALRMGYARLVTDRSAPPLPEPERRQVATLAGEGFDTQLGHPRLTNQYGGMDDREEIRGRLRRATVAVLTRYEGLSEATAHRQLADGSWTDDPAAAAFFATEAIERPLAGRLRARLAGESSFRTRAARVVAVLVRRVDAR